MRVLTLLLLALPAPLALASPGFETREGTLSVSCTMAYASALDAGVPVAGCVGDVVFPAGPVEGGYVAELSWVTARPGASLAACLSTLERAAAVPGVQAWTLVASHCEEGEEGALTLRVPASEEDGRVRLRVQLGVGEGEATTLLRHWDQDVSYTLRHGS